MAKEEKNNFQETLEKILDAGGLARLKNYQDYINRISAGENLKLTEKKHFDELHKEFSDVSDSDKTKDRYSSKETMELLGIDKRMLSYHTTKGNLKKETDGTYLLSTIREWEEKYRRKGSKTNQGKTILEQIDRADLRWRLAKARREEQLYKLSRGDLIAADQVYQEWALRVRTLFAGVKLWSHRLAPRLEGKNRDEMIAIFDEETYILMKTFSEKGRYCPEVDGVLE